VSSTADGGGVAEILRSFLGYATGIGVDARWMVLDGDAAFFRFTKRLYELVHGVAKGGLPDARDRATYERVTAGNARGLARLVRPGDVVVLHDPQTAGLVEPLVEHGARVVWRSHVGTDQHNAATGHAWEFLLPLVEPADAFVFTGAWAVPRELTARTVHTIAPSIDPQAEKNRPLAPADAERVLRSAGLAFAVHPRLVLHIGRWDRLKDPSESSTCSPSASFPTPTRDWSWRARPSDTSPTIRRPLPSTAPSYVGGPPCPRGHAHGSMLRASHSATGERMR